MNSFFPGKAAKPSQMIPFSSAIRIVLRNVPYSKVTAIGPGRALCRVLAEDIFSLSSSPGFDRSVMDGFALNSKHVSSGKAALPVEGFIPAGTTHPVRLRKGRCIAIATGAMMPAGADSVVRKEDVIVRAGKCIISKKISAGENVHKKGWECKKGEKILKKGCILGLPQLGLLSSQGFERVKVYRRPTAAFLRTGNEIVLSGARAQKGMVRDSCGPVVLEGLKQLGIDPMDLGRAKDRMTGLLEKIRQGMKYDLLILSGGVSVGKKDFVPLALKKAGVKCLFHKVAVKPGKPVWFGKKGRTLVFGLPGNPVSSLVAFSLFVKPAIKVFCGEPAPSLSQGALSTAARNDEERLSFLPCRIKRKDGKEIIEPLSFKGSADILSVCSAEGFFALQAGEKKKKGDKIKFFRI